MHLDEFVGGVMKLVVRRHGHTPVTRLIQHWRRAASDIHEVWYHSVQPSAQPLLAVDGLDRKHIAVKVIDVKCIGGLVDDLVSELLPLGTGNWSACGNERRLERSGCTKQTRVSLPSLGVLLSIRHYHVY